MFPEYFLTCGLILSTLCHAGALPPSLLNLITEHTCLSVYYKPAQSEPTVLVLTVLQTLQAWAEERVGLQSSDGHASDNRRQEIWSWDK